MRNWSSSIHCDAFCTSWGVKDIASEVYAGELQLTLEQMEAGRGKYTTIEIPATHKLKFTPM
jgi:hypothetical protein